MTPHDLEKNGTADTEILGSSEDLPNLKKWYILKLSYFFFTCILELLRPSKSTLKLTFLRKENLECKDFDVFLTSINCACEQC